MEAFINLFETYGLWTWGSIVLLLLIVETMATTGHLIWPAIAAAALALLKLFGLDLPMLWQIGLFAVATIGLTIAAKPLVTAWRAERADKVVNEISQGMIGRRIVVIQDFANGRGRVRVGDTDWSARTDHIGPIKIGDPVVVVAVESATLIVAPAT